ncbi:MAG TPA: alpha/beta hydrolase [Ramlibacter sp.]|uniref:esterase/lipase family protein n=1 Tax=Ramlibacter sp. TaxID=1917967 RepID=UPI002D359002|nr:alpha/beta hydrolase [Ramlibacter sp.]HZY16893.1 alpha/beta hydrolase [Ramlibacter sp.]
MSATPPPESPAQQPHHAAGTVRDLRGGMRLAVDGVRGAIGLVEEVHERLAHITPPVRGFSPGRPGRGWPAFVYRSLRGTTDLVGGGLDLLLASVQASLQTPQRDRAPEAVRPTREALVAALNALAGDHLHRTDNPLAVALQLRLPRAPARPRVLVLVHDLGLNDLQWRQDGHDHGEALAAALDCTPVYVQYNTGRHVAASGRELAAELERRLGSWPVALQGLAMLGHGMGGLVLRSALDQAVRAGMGWPTQLQKLVFLGTPHLGARLGSGLDLLLRSGLGAQAMVAPLVRLGRRRSDGIDDVLQGRYLDPDAGLAAPLAPPWPPGCAVHAIAGVCGDGTGDGLVPLASALGRAESPAQDLQIPEDHRWIAQGVDHLGLLRSEAVLGTMRQWLSA